MILRLYRTSGSVDIQRSDGRDSKARRRRSRAEVRRYRRHARPPHWRWPGGWRPVIGRRRTATPGVRVAWQRGRQLLEDPRPSGKCVRASRCDLNDHVTSRRFVVNMVRAVSLHAGDVRPGLHSCPNYRFIWSLETISVEKHVY